MLEIENVHARVAGRQILSGPGLGLLALGLASPLPASAALGQERCLVAQYTLPASIAEEMRPYLVCGMFTGDGHFTTRVNGMGTSTRGRLEDCRTIRSLAFEAAERRLTRTMPDASARQAFLTAEFESADRFLAVLARSEDRAIDAPATAPQCRNPNAQN